MSVQVTTTGGYRLTTSLGARMRRAVASGTGIIALLYIVLYFLYSLWDPTALTADTVLNLANNAAPLAISAVA